MTVADWETPDLGTFAMMLASIDRETGKECQVAVLFNRSTEPKDFTSPPTTSANGVALRPAAAPRSSREGPQRRFLGREPEFFHSSDVSLFLMTSSGCSLRELLKDQVLFMPQEISLKDVPGLVGTVVGVSDWITVDQPMIDAFAGATMDHQFIHTDPVRAAAETPFGGTIAHGFLTLSLLSAMNYNCLPKIIEQTMGINYGFEKVRFMSPVKTANAFAAPSGLPKPAFGVPAC